MRFMLIFISVLLIVVCFVQAIGVAKPYFDDDTARIDSNETLNITFQLQNMDDVSKTVVFRVQSSNDMRIEGGSFYENTYALASGERRDVQLKFKANAEGLYRIDYSLKENCPVGQSFCFSMAMEDSFFIQVGDDSTYWGFAIPLNYSGYHLYTHSKDASNVDDLRIISSDGFIEADFSGTTLDLGGFQQSFISFGVRLITANNSLFDVPAKLTFYQINDNYIILKDEKSCPLSICKSVSYSNKKLKFNVPGFSSYRIAYEGSSSSSSSSSSGGISTAQNKSVSNKSVEPMPESEPEPEQQEPPAQIDLSQISTRPNPFTNGSSREVAENPDLAVKQSTEGKDLLTSSVILGVIAIAMVGLLFYVAKKDIEVKS